MKDFLNPKAMMTPGAAGSMMMLLANTVCNFFPEIEFRYVALALSFFIGMAVLMSLKMKLMERGVYWVLNSLIIFTVGVGTSNIAANVAASPAAAHNKALLDFIIPNAVAASADDRTKKMREELEKLRAENAKLKSETQKSQPNHATASGDGASQNEETSIKSDHELKPAQRSFFKRW